VFVSLVGLTVATFWSPLTRAEEGERSPAKPADEANVTPETVESTVAQGFPLARYAALWQRSLFHASVPTKVADAAFARDYSLAGVFEMDGSVTAALLHKRDGSVVDVSDDSTTGMRLITVEASSDPSKSRVQVEMDGQRAWINAIQSASPTTTHRSSSSPTKPDGGEMTGWQNSSAQGADPRSSPGFESAPPPPQAPVPVPIVLPMHGEKKVPSHGAQVDDALPLPPSPLDVDFPAAAADASGVDIEN
jgi:hypothetical protein